MSDDETPASPGPTPPSDAGESVPKTLSEPARRALAEAQARRKAIDAQAAAVAAEPEKDGRGGLEPVRYGDWEVKGLASDF